MGWIKVHDAYVEMKPSTLYKQYAFIQIVKLNNNKNKEKHEPETEEF